MKDRCHGEEAGEAGKIADERLGLDLLLEIHLHVRLEGLTPVGGGPDHGKTPVAKHLGEVEIPTQFLRQKRKHLPMQGPARQQIGAGLFQLAGTRPQQDEPHAVVFDEAMHLVEQCGQSLDLVHHDRRAAGDRSQLVRKQRRLPQIRLEEPLIQEIDPSGPGQRPLGPCAFSRSTHAEQEETPARRNAQDSIVYGLLYYTVIYTGKMTAWPHIGNFTNAAVWSADSRWIVYDTRSGADGAVFDGTRIERVEVATGTIERLYESRDGACCGVVTASPTDDRILFRVIASRSRDLSDILPGMVLYLDICCIKRPFDDQSQPRIRLESEAVLGLLAAESDSVRFVRSPALWLENEQNPLPTRAARVRRWLGAPQPFSDTATLVARASDIMKLGVKNFDALHVASAEAVGADALATCDDRFLAAARRAGDLISVRVLGVLELAAEVL